MKVIALNLFLLFPFLLFSQNEIDSLLINNESVKGEINLIAAHLYPQISLLRHQSIEYNIEAKKVLFLALNMIELAFEKYKK